LLQSGVKIEGLQAGGGAPAPKKVVYGNKKVKPAPGVKDTSTVASSERAPSPPPDSVPASPAVAPASTSKDDWDASSDGEPPVVDSKPDVAPGVKDDWDASSEEETPAANPPKAEEPAKPSAGKIALAIIIMIY
jgi:translation initiation factor 5B